jgi:hypothetical protein
MPEETKTKCSCGDDCKCGDNCTCPKETKTEESK